MKTEHIHCLGYVGAVSRDALERRKMGSISNSSIWKSLQVRLIATEVRSSISMHCCLISKARSHALHTKRAQVREQDGIGSSALDRNRDAIDHTISA
jgi:hypothetical protein